MKGNDNCEQIIVTVPKFSQLKHCQTLCDLCVWEISVLSTCYSKKPGQTTRLPHRAPKNPRKSPHRICVPGLSAQQVDRILTNWVIKGGSIAGLPRFQQLSKQAWLSSSVRLLLDAHLRHANPDAQTNALGLFRIPAGPTPNWNMPNLNQYQLATSHNFSHRPLLQL